MNVITRWLHLTTAVMLCVFATACAGPSAPTGKLPEKSERIESRLRSGDQITVRLDTGSTQGPQALDVVIDGNGEISLPLIGRVKAAGQTQAELGERIQANYVPRFYV